jgi:hypothetical protein
VKEAGTIIGGGGAVWHPAKAIAAPEKKTAPIMPRLAMSIRSAGLWVGDETGAQAR